MSDEIPYRLKKNDFGKSLEHATGARKGAHPPVREAMNHSPYLLDKKLLDAVRKIEDTELNPAPTVKK